MLHTNFRKIGRMVPEQKSFEGFLTYMGMATILVMSSIMSLNFNFLEPKSLHTKFGLKRPTVF